MTAAATPAYRCADAAEARGDSLAASAPPVRRWLLIELPGAWGPRGLWDTAVDRDLSRTLLRRAAAADARLLVIRRPGRTDATTRRRWYVVDSRPGHEATRTGAYDGLADLLDLPLDGSAGNRVDGPMYLVCTHARHDPCCAIRGRPVAAALADVRSAVWECSHVGGDRFAANVVVLPHGLYYGHIRPSEVAELVTTHESGRLLVSRYRSRSSMSAPEQTAQDAARLRLGLDGIDDLAVLSCTPDAAGGWTVRLGGPDGPMSYTVSGQRRALDHPLTCHAEHNGLVTVLTARQMGII